MANPIEQLRGHGQSIWFDYIRRGLITSGGLERMIRDGWITGVTSNPTIFQRAIAGSNDYDEALKEIAQRGECSPYEAFLEVGGDDIRMAADALRPLYEETDRADGYVSFEVQEGTTEEMIAEAKRLFELVGRPNVMIKVPGTQPGVNAVEQLIADGININVTLLFDVAVYEQAARAYIAGLERRLQAGRPLSDLAGVASFFVSRVDTKIDALLPEESPLRGKVAIANARFAYQRFKEIFAGPAWDKLADAGARVQRPLWGSTGTKNPAYRDVMYIEELVAPSTVNTVPEPTLMAFLDHGQVRPNVEDEFATAGETLKEAEKEGIDLKRVTGELLTEGLASFAKDFDALLEEIGKALPVAPAGRARYTANLGPLDAAVGGRLETLREQEAVRRIWQHDHTLWKPQPTEITDRLGWLGIVDVMLDSAADLQSFAAAVATDGYKTAVLLGMGGSSLAPEVLHTTFGVASAGLELSVLDTTDPASIRAVEERIDLEQTLFIIASKSGTTVETLSHLAYFWEKLPDGKHFIAITDPDTPLARLAKERGFRRVFINAADIGGRYSALSYFGLVPAALIGADIDAILGRAHEMLHACGSCVAPRDNPGAWLGAVMSEASLAGRDKLTLVLPEEISALGYWVEQLIAESTGKEGKGILPVEGEPLGAPEHYGDDRVFVAIGEHDRLDALERAGHPVVRLPYTGPLQIGGEFFRWEFATAVAGHVLGINAFDQPNVQEAKDATGRILDAGGEPAAPQTPPLGNLLELVRPGDYIAIQAYLQRSPDVDRALQAARVKMRDRYKVATTVGFGPRFLHSTGQLHKGGPDTGVFIQVLGDDASDLEIPGKSYTFGSLKRAQALGDLTSLIDRGRRVARTTIEELGELGA